MCQPVKGRIIMKKRQIAAIAVVMALCTIVSGGCGKKTARKDTRPLTPDDMHPAYYSDDTGIPSGTYCIAHKTSGKNGAGVVYYPLYAAENTGEPSDDATGESGDRFFWLNYNVDEGKLPTMYPGDQLIYKSDKSVPAEYTIEKFFDEGYTVGVAGLYENEYNKPAFDTGNDKCVISKHSDARILRTIAKKVTSDDDDDVEIVFNAMDKEELAMDRLDSAGMIYGLDEGRKYNFDLRIGTKSYPASMTANVHEFRLGETYKYKSIDYITDTMIRVNLPDFMTTGYYEINGSGAFRFLKTGTSYKDLKPKDYNDFIYTYSGGRPTGSVDGLILNDDGYLVTYEEYISQEAAEDRKDYGTGDVEDYSDEEITGGDDASEADTGSGQKDDGSSAGSEDNAGKEDTDKQERAGDSKKTEAAADSGKSGSKKETGENG